MTLLLKPFLDATCPAEKCLLLGKRGKTSLSFSMAYAVASCDSDFPLFICNKEKIEGNFPSMMVSWDESTNSPAEKDSWSLETLSRIDMKYVTNAHDLKAVFASIQMYKRKPKLIVIDDLSTIIDPSFNGRTDPKFQETLVTVLSFIADGINWLESSSLRPIQLIITDKTSEPVYTRIVSRLCTSLIVLEEDINRRIQVMRKLLTTDTDFDRIFFTDCYNNKIRIHQAS